MKNLEKNVAKHERRAKRRLAKVQAKKLEGQAAKFREDALKHGAELTVMGSNPYKLDHPAYEELIRPLLERAANIASRYGFNALFQVHTPMPGCEKFTACIGTINAETATPTMLGCIELIEERPSIGKVNGEFVAGETKLSELLFGDKKQPPEASE